MANLIPQSKYISYAWRGFLADTAHAWGRSSFKHHTEDQTSNANQSPNRVDEMWYRRFTGWSWKAYEWVEKDQKYEWVAHTGGDLGDPNNYCGANEMDAWLYGKINAGQHTVIYEGHGGQGCLGMGEGSGRRIFRVNEIGTNLNNTGKYPFIIADACETGYFDKTTADDMGSVDCLAEVSIYLQKPSGQNIGAIGFLGSSRSSFASAFNYVDRLILEAEYNHLSHIMGEAVMESKLLLSSTLFRRQYNLYGDPALNLWPTGYTITEPLTLTGNNTISENITVAAGVTLTVSAGANLRFTNSSSLIVNGTLTANGTSNNRITFNFIAKNNNGVTVNSGGTANISYSDISNAISGINFNYGTGTVDHCTITNCNYGVLVTSATPTIQYSTISNNSYGIKVMNSYSQSWTARNFSNNTITGNTTYGLYLYNSSPTLSYNTINSNSSGTVLWDYCNPIMNHNIMNSNTNYGLACYGSANPNLYNNPTYSFGGNNVVRMNGNRGIVITSSSNPNIGNAPPSYGGYNSIFGNTGYEIDNTTNNNIWACRNWWGNPSGPQTGDINGTVNSLYPLPSDPNPLLKMSIFTPSFVYDSTINIPIELQQANYEMVINNYEKSSEILKEYLHREKIDVFGNLAAVLFLKDIDFYLDNKSMVNEVELLLKSKLCDNGRFELLLGLSLIYQKINNNNAALDCLDKVLTMKLSSEQKIRFLFQKAFLYKFSFKDNEKAKFYLNEILNSNEKSSMDYQLALDELNSPSDFSNNSKPEISNPKLPDITKAELPTVYKIFNNYPNPFNPSTTIKYALLKESDVQLIIYDIIGREVKTLVSSKQDAGYKEVVWNGTDNNNQKVSSGIYIYRLRATSVEDLKVFDKSAKLVLMK